MCCLCRGNSKNYHRPRPKICDQRKGEKTYCHENACFNLPLAQNLAAQGKPLKQLQKRKINAECLEVILSHFTPPQQPPISAICLFVMPPASTSTLPQNAHTTLAPRAHRNTHTMTHVCQGRETDSNAPLSAALLMATS